MGRVEGKVVLVTGGASGIGKATCLLLAREGAAVAVTDVDERAGQAVGEQITREGGVAGSWRMDVTQESQIQCQFAAVVERFGRLDVLVNNAAISGAGMPTDALSEEQWQAVIDVNAKGVFLCTKAAIPHMRRGGGGSIVNVSSIYGLVGSPEIPPYHAAKGAVTLMTKTDALLYAKERIG